MVLMPFYHLFSDQIGDIQDIPFPSFPPTLCTLCCVIDGEPMATEHVMVTFHLTPETLYLEYDRRCAMFSWVQAWVFGFTRLVTMN